MSKKYAVVDLGSNTIRLSAYNVLDNGDFDLLFSEKEMAGMSTTSTRRACSPATASTRPARCWPDSARCSATSA